MLYANDELTTRNQFVCASGQWSHKNYVSNLHILRTHVLDVLLRGRCRGHNFEKKKQIEKMVKIIVLRVQCFNCRFCIANDFRSYFPFKLFVFIAWHRRRHFRTEGTTQSQRPQSTCDVRNRRNIYDTCRLIPIAAKRVHVDEWFNTQAHAACATLLSRQFFFASCRHL